MKKIYSFLSLCLLFLGLTTATAQTAELKLTFDRTGDNVSVSVAGLDGVTASVVSKSHAWKDLGVANANTILCPNVNGNTDPTITWGLQINGVPANYKLNGVALDIHALNGAGQYQDPADAVARHWNVAIAQGGTTVANFADIEISQGTEEGRTMGNNHKVHSVAAAEALAATDPMTLDFTVTKGSENKGCFFGLSEVTLTYDVEEVVVEPVTFVNSTPAAGSTVETLSVFTMTFNKELASVDPEMMMMLYGGMNPIPSEVQINGTDAKTITVTLQEPYSLAGGYIYYIAAGSLVAADGSVNEEDIMLEYNIEAAPNSFGNVYAAPASGSTVESLKTITMGFMGEVASVSKNAINVVDGEGATVTTATLATDDFDFNAVVVTMAQEITAAGTYKVVIPEGYINSAAGTYNPELTLTYTIEGVEEPEVPATPVVITEVAQLSNAKCYTLVSADTGRGGMYALADKVDMCGVTYNQAQTCHGVARDNADPKQQFAFVEYEGKHYLYSVSEKKFVMKSGDTNALVGTAPFEFVTVEKVGESTFALKANDTNYFTASPGWCANPSRGTCIQSTLTSKSKDDGWDEGAWFTITEVADFNADEAIAMLTPAPVVEPLALVKANPELETEVTSLSSITLTFNKEIASVSAEPYMFWFVNADMTNMYDAEVQINATDAKTLTITLAEEIKEAGTYIAMFSQGALVAADGTSNETAVEMAWTVKPEVVEPEPTELELVKANPALETEVSSLGSITLTFNKEIASVTLNESTFYFMATDFSKVFTTADVQVNATDAKSVTLTLPEVITAEGEYVAMLMNGAVVATDGTSNQGIIEMAWTVKAAPAVEPLKLVSIDPACAHYEVMPANLKLTFSNDIKTLEFGMLRTDFTGVRGYTLAEEDYTIAGNELTINVPADYVNGAANMMLTLAVIDVNDQYVTYAYDEAELNQDYVVLMYTADMKSDLFVMESSDPEAGVVEKLDVINVTFGNGGYTYVGGFDKSKEVVVLNADEEVVAKAAMEIVEMTETEDGETFSWPTSTVKFTLDTPVTEAGEYTLVIPEATVYNEGYYEEAEDFGASYGAIYNPEVRIEYTIEGEAVLDYTPLHNGTKTRSDRNVTAVKLNSILGNNVYDLTSMERSQDYTDATAVATFKVAAGEELTAVVEHAGEWVHHAVYVDLEGDGFQSSIEEGSEWKPAGDLMAYSFYNNGGSSDEYGYNSVGNTLAGQDRHMPSLPAFNAPTQPGTYRMRFVQTWCSIDPNGDNDGKFGDFKNNGDQIVDVLLEVVDATGINSIGVDANNDVYTLDGRQVNVQAGKKLNKGIYIVGGKKVYVK